MDKYVKKIDIDFRVSDSSIKNVNNVLNEFKKNGAFSDDEIKKYVDAFKKEKGLLGEISTLEAQIKKFQDSKVAGTNEIIKGLRQQINIRREELKLVQAINDEEDEIRLPFKERFKNWWSREDTGGKARLSKLTTSITGRMSGFGDATSGSTIGDTFGGMIGGLGKVVGGFAEGWQKGLINVGTMMLDKFQDIVSDALKEMDNILESSQLSSSSTRETMFEFGFSQSQAYGYEKALSLVGLTGIEDLMYANEEERREFQEAFDKYTTRYDELYDEGFFTEMQQFKYEMADFKQEVTLKFIQFIIDNKDTIMKAMDAIIVLTEFTLDALSAILKVIDQKTYQDKYHNMLLSGEALTQISNSSKVSNVAFYNNYTNVTKADETWISNSNEMALQQVRKMLEMG